MHRAINIKHRIVRRVDIGKAPLATFDTIDLGDEDVNSCSSEHNKPCSETFNGSHQPVTNAKAFVNDGGLKTETIGGNNSKKSLSQAGGEEKENKDAPSTKTKSQSGGGEVENVGNTNQNKGEVTDIQSSDTKQSEAHLSETGTQEADTATGDKEADKQEGQWKGAASTCLTRQGTIGRVSIPIKKQNSDSSSSSGSCNETNFTLTRPSVAHLETADAEEQAPESEAEKDTFDSLLPDNIDPSQILSPSKRKAYERRIERLKVTTSPIARPRSAAPISVVTLDEYATISSPEASPASPVVQDKLKITLPTDEFAAKPKTPKLSSAKRRDSDEIAFEFTEEILFSRTKSALVVDEDGQLPLSPRRVLIPPTITPTTSPKLSAAPRFLSNTSNEDIPKLVYIKHNESALKFFGETVDETDEENWASFPDFGGVEGNVENETVTASPQETSVKGETFTKGALPDQRQQPTSGDQSQGSVGPPPVQSDKGEAPTELQSDLTSEPKTDICQQGSEAQHAEKQTVSSQLIEKNDEQNVASSADLVTGASVQPPSQNIPTDRPTNLSSVTAASIPQVELFPDIESEEILTVEIQQSASGCDKHIEIDIKSSGSSGSLSPAYPEPSQKLEKLGSDIALASQKLEKPDSDIVLGSCGDFACAQADSEVHPSVGSDSGDTKSITKPVPSVTLSNQDLDVLLSHQTSSQQSAEVVKEESESQSAHSLPQSHSPSTVQEPAAQAFSSIFESPTPVPQTLDYNSVNDIPVCPAEQKPQNLNQSQQEELQSVSDPGADLQIRHPATNPFISGFDPPESDPFDLGLPQATTNPFLVESSITTSATSDLIDFSSSFDKPAA